MTPLEKIKALSNEYREECAKAGGNPRRPLDSLGWDMADLSGELLALWEAANKWKDAPYYFDNEDQRAAYEGLESAVERLNAKAAEVLK